MVISFACVELEIVELEASVTVAKAAAVIDISVVVSAVVDVDGVADCEGGVVDSEPLSIDREVAEESKVGLAGLVLGKVEEVLVMVLPSILGL